MTITSAPVSPVQPCQPRVPVRVQRKRTKGWTTPLCTCGCGLPARYVGRGSVFGNPFIFGHKWYGLVQYGPKHLERFGRAWDYEGRCSAAGTSHDLFLPGDEFVRTDVRMATRPEVVELYRLTILDPTPSMLRAYPSGGGHFLKVTVAQIREQPAGHDLMCWCPVTDDHGRPVPCHADVLLELAAPTKIGA